MKKTALVLTALMCMAPAFAQSTPTADNGLTNAAVTFEIRRAGNDLASMLVALAQSAGYGIILDPTVDSVLRAYSGNAAANAAAAGTPTSTGVVPDSVTYNFANKPFNEVWPLVLDLYGLSYERLTIGNQTVLRVTTNPIQRIVQLPASLDAGQVERQLKLSFGTPASATTTANAAAPASNATTTTPDEIVLDSKTMRIIAETASNSVIIRGTNQEVAQVERLLNEIIAAQPKAPEATGEATATGAGTQRVYTANGKVADVISLLRIQYPGIRVTPVGQTGNLVLNGSTVQLDAAMQLLTQVDRPVTGTGEQVVQQLFQLSNASAEEVKATLQGTLERQLSEEIKKTSQTTTVEVTNPDGTKTTRTSPVENTVSKSTSDEIKTAATIIADKRTNTLIVRGTPEQVRQIAEIIPTLDKAVPQINLQVKIQEITESAGRALGVNWKVGFLGFSVDTRDAQGQGLTASFDPTRTLAGFNIFPTLRATEEQGLSKSVYDGTVTMQSGQAAVGSLAGAENSSARAAATIKSGGKVEIVEPSRVIDYGMILDFINPQVSPDGSISVRVRANVSDLIEPQPVQGNSNVFRFSNTEAETLIKFKPGQTVLLSGLLSQKETSSKNGIPFFSMIPVVGTSFGKQNSSKQSTQLLIIITGNTVQ